MKTRSILKLLAIALLIEAITQATKHPFLFNKDYFDQMSTILSDGIAIYFSTLSLWVQLVLYGLFAIYVCVLDSKFPHAHFGRWFRYDFFVAIINTILMSIQMENPIFDVITKTLTELFAVGTSFLAGYSIYNFFKTDAMKTIFYSYALLSLRHLIYSLILLWQIFSHLGTELTKEANYATTLIIVSWILLMPLLVVSRIILVKGTFMIKRKKTHKQSKE